MAAATSNTTSPKSDLTDEAFVHVSAERVSSEKQNDEELDAKNELINDELTDLVAEKSALRKFDWILLPQIMMIAIMAALDRINIGNARVMGFEEAIGLTGSQFNDIAMVFSPTYILFEIPWVVAVPYFGIHRVLAVAGLGWGVVTLGTGFIHNYGQAIATRVLLGIFEAALVPCLVFIISLIWPRESQAKRVGFIYIASSISGGFGGLIAYAIQISGTRHGLEPWRWLFIVEGVVSTGLAMICWIALPKSAEDAWFLTEREKSAMMAKKQREIVYKGEALFTWANFKAACLEPLVWLAGVTLFSNSCAVTGYAVFLPTILAGMGYTSVQANYLTIPIYAFTGIMVMSSAYTSDRLQRRGIILAMLPLLPIVGYSIAIGTSNRAAGYFGMYLCAAGLISFTCIFLTWLSNNIAPDSKRSVALPTLVSIANLSGICSPYIYQRDDAPRFVRGNSISLSFAVMVVILVVSMYFLLLKRNKEKKRLLSEGVTDNGLTGDRALNFEYKL
ncbi:hypothetical protein PV10_00004 [Exophiala mesophila]|uniref:Major facilitator superfamily (MFS) profile domain-containing protein n=1 Tax=Exophiala mesophila TaxID=212818 RepID=A0A0D1X2X7_EXOME|nr:uncharacterized protein PV10_00004 [Exophiala mesophila]KIV96100.1 hypothetical protein PV10_00004 [Exophiala mesophila]